MTQELTNLLKDLSNTTSVSGYEHRIRNFLRERYAPYVDEFTEDKVGSLIMLKRGTPSNNNAPRRKIMLAAHLDEIGAIVTNIDRGFLRFTNVGGLDIRLLMGQEVTVFGRKTYHGVIASRPPHFQDEDRSKYPNMTEYQIDLGLPADVVAKNIRVGDIVAMRKSPTELLEGHISGKALDNRSSLVSVYVCLKELHKITHEWDVYAVATCQEEVGLKGATTTAYRINPDVAIAIDVTFGEVPGISEDYQIQLNKGPVLTVGANIHPVMAERLQEVAKNLEMNLQIEAEPGRTGTDAWAIQISQAGIPTGLLNIPLRYMHSPIEVVNIKDINRIGRLMAHFISHLTEDFIADLTPKDGLEE